MRVLPKRTRFHYASWALVGALIAAAVTVLVISVVKCATTYSTWSTTRPYQCDAGAGAFVGFTSSECSNHRSQLTESIDSSIGLEVDVISDLLLVVVPLWALWQETRLAPTIRHIIKIGFAANVLTAISSLVTGIIFLTNCMQDQILVALRLSTHIMVSSGKFL